MRSCCAIALRVFLILCFAPHACTVQAAPARCHVSTVFVTSSVPRKRDRQRQTERLLREARQTERQTDQTLREGMRGSRVEHRTSLFTQHAQSASPSPTSVPCNMEVPGVGGTPHEVHLQWAGDTACTPATNSRFAGVKPPPTAEKPTWSASGLKASALSAVTGSPCASTFSAKSSKHYKLPVGDHRA